MFCVHHSWEYKGQHADLNAAYRQLQLYLDDLENPPLLVVCDLDRFVIRTHFTGTPTETYRFALAELDQPEPLRVLRAVFTDPASLRPRRTTAAVTEEAAERFGALATRLAARGVAPERAAHFLVQLLFCLFAEDAGLLPKGLFTDLLAYCARYPAEFPAQIETLLGAMRDGGSVAFKRIDRFNGGLFADVAVEPLTGRSWPSSPPPLSSTGRRWNRPSSAPSSSARSTPTSERNWGRTTPGEPTSSGSSSRS